MKKDTLSKNLREHYHINPAILDKSVWGYNTIGYYVQDTNGKRYIAKLTEYSKERRIKAEKDDYLSSLLHGKLPTSEYLKNDKGKVITLVEDEMLRVVKFIEGATPFDMNMEIFEQVVESLEIIHETPLQEVKINIPPTSIEKTREPKLLHGDLTASNIIVADNRINGVLDFEEALIGPVEFDLAKSAVFCWFRMENVTFKKVLSCIPQNYTNKIDMPKIHELSVMHAQNHLDQVVKNKRRYKDTVFWNDDYNFSREALETIQKTKI